MKRVPWEDRFVSKIEFFGNDDCWRWTGTKRLGYGRFALERRTVTAHRLAWQTWVGPVPLGFQLDHLCRNRGCVNPDHLEVVTNAENTLRGYQFVGPRSHCRAGHEMVGDNVRGGGRSGLHCGICRNEWQQEYRRQKKAKRGGS